MTIEEKYSDLLKEMTNGIKKMVSPLSEAMVEMSKILANIDLSDLKKICESVGK